MGGGVGQKIQNELNSLFAGNTLNLNHEAVEIFLTIGKDGRKFSLNENHLYGSARLGVDNRELALYDNIAFRPKGSLAMMIRVC